MSLPASGHKSSALRLAELVLTTILFRHPFGALNSTDFFESFIGNDSSILSSSFTMKN